MRRRRFLAFGGALAPSLALSLSLLPLALGINGCATPGGPVTGGAAPQVRVAPDDSEPSRVVPLGPETVVELDMAQLRANAWSRSLVAGLAPEDRQARTAAQGFDDVTDVDRVVFAVTEVAGADPAVLTVWQGRFSQERVARALFGGATASPPTPWRGSPLWQQGGRAVAFVTSRTVVSGEVAAVRAAIDCAYGVVPDVTSGEVGTLRRSLDGGGSRPALLAAVTVSDSLRQRVGGDFELPHGLRRVGARLDLGAALDTTLVGIFDDARQAAAAARLLEARLDDLRRRPVLRILGLSPLLDQASLQPQGPRVWGRLHLPEDRREDLGQRVGLILEGLMKARGR